MKDMTVEQFRCHVIENIQKFEEFWKENAKQDPEGWPESLPPEEWHEQWIMAEGEFEGE